MPNWTINALLVHNEDLTRILARDGTLSFERWRPMPPTLMQEESPTTIDAALDAAAGKDLATRRPECLRRRLDWVAADGTQKSALRPTQEQYAELGRILIDNKRKYGSMTWYAWCNRNWGTKWDAQNVHIMPADKTHTIIVFDTAWSQPNPGLLRDMTKSLAHEWVFEASYEDGPLVGDPDRRQIKDESAWRLFKTETETYDGHTFTNVVLRDTFDHLDLK